MKKILLSIFAVLIFAVAGLVIYIKTALPNVGPPSEIKIEGTQEQIERGKYLANSVCVCIDCHSTRDWTKLAGPIVPGTIGKGGEAFNKDLGFPGDFYSRNITPAGLGEWTDGEILRAITCGVSKNGTALFPVMPYKNYGQMDTEDIKSIIAYLRTLAPIENSIPDSHPAFPMNLIINTIPSPATPVKRPQPEDVLEYGKYLVNAASCGDCHTQQEKGEKIKGMDFAGGFEFKLPSGIVRSQNITPHETGIKNWSKKAFINRFKMYSDSSFKETKVGKNDFQTVMPWKMYSTMTEEDLGAIYDYLMTIRPVENKVVRFTPKTSI